MPSTTLWSGEEIKQSTEQKHHPKEETFWTPGQTIDEKRDLFNIKITGSVGLAIPSAIGTVKATGSLENIDKPQVFSQN